MINEVVFLRDGATGQVLFDALGNPKYATNPNALTFGAMQTRVTYEVLGSPTPADATQAIQDAIAQFERESFWFNDMRTFGAVTGSLSDLQTVQAKEFYSAQDLQTLVNMPHIRQIQVLAFNNRYTLNERTQQWIADQSISTTWQGLPTDWCWNSGALQLYPVPDGGYPLIITGTIRFPGLVNNSDFNCWTNDAEWLIRSEAKRLLFTNIIRDADQAMAIEMEVYGNPRTGRQGALQQLRRETMRRAGGTGRLRASRGYM